jgi:hypothetical protein
MLRFNKNVNKSEAPSKPPLIQLKTQRKKNTKKTNNPKEPAKPILMKKTKRGLEKKRAP